ncbi:hypothetical protein VTJ49DRAFT_2262 [Mycothermus thermophilus]|uniref:Putative transcription factor kapC n=1 Tax=Humicola insolens TaxID=85995 RepID=A0ABR3VA64_HUMIN
MMTAAPAMSHPGQGIPMQAPPPPVVGAPVGQPVPQPVAPAGAPAEAQVTDDGRKAKRPLSTSKRAAQNRAAQRAFRQRKEHYIKQLEQKVRDAEQLEANYKALQAEHYSLRDYTLRLQALLIDTQGECPAPPPGINLHQQPPNAQPADPGAMGQQPPPDSAAAVNPLEVAAQAVAGLNRSASEHYGQVRSTADEDARTAQELTRQLQAEGSTDGLPTPSM